MSLLFPESDFFTCTRHQTVRVNLPAAEGSIGPLLVVYVEQ